MASAGLLCALITASAASQAAGAATPPSRFPLRRVSDVRLPGGTTRFDYQSIDAAARRLYIAHLGDSTVLVVDLDTLHTVATIRNIADVHGVLAVPELNRVFATATGTNEVVTIDATTDRIVDRTPTGEFPDGLAYDPDHDLVVVSNKDAGSETIIDTRTDKVINTFKLGDEVGNIAYDTTMHLAWVAVRSPDELVALDPTTGAIKARIRLTGCDGAHGVYLQTASRTAFVACENNARLAVVDTNSRRPIARLRVGESPDVLAYDPGDSRLYVAAESGTVTVIATAPKARVLARAYLANTAHSVAIDPTNHRVYFPLQNEHGHPALRVMEPTAP